MSPSKSSLLSPLQDSQAMSPSKSSLLSPLQAMSPSKSSLLSPLQYSQAMSPSKSSLLSPLQDSQAMSPSSSKPLLKPLFVIHPKDSYLIKNKPVTLRCKAQHAVKLKFKCSGGLPGETHEKFLVDPDSGMQEVDSTLDITKTMVEEYFGTEHYSCLCNSWNDDGVKTSSSSAKILIAYLKKHFFEPPYSDPVALGSQVEMRCLPPDGVPSPKTYWLKNDKPIDFEQQKNYRISSEGSLLIHSAGWKDTANYSCVAENLAARRQSPPAELKIYVDGSWSTWSPWSPCSTRCGKGVQKRIRTCTNPPPSNGGGSCKGRLAFQQTECTSTDCQPIDGSWSDWSEWSICGPDCLQHSNRLCNSPAPLFGGKPCAGKDFVSRNCIKGFCSKYNVNLDIQSTKAVQEKAIEQDIALIIALSVLIPLVLLLLLILFKKCKLKWRMPNHLYETANSEYQFPLYSGSKQKRTFKSLPTVKQSINEVAGTTRESMIDNDSKSRETQRTNRPTSEHLYDVPLMKNMADFTPTDIICNANKNIDEKSHCVTMGNSKIDYSRAATLRHTLQTCGSKFYNFEGDPSSFDVMGVHGEGAVWREVGSHGGRLTIPEYGITLTVPEGSIPDGVKYKLFLAVLPRTKLQPMLDEKQTILTPVIWCGPSSASLQKPSILSFEHSGSVQQATWKLHVMSTAEPPTSSDTQWKKIVTLGEERVDTSVYTQLDGSQVHLMVDRLQSYALVGESASTVPAAKLVKVVTSALPPTSEMNFEITINIVPNTDAHLKFLTQQEKRRGACLLNKPKNFILLDCGADLLFSLEDVANGWDLSSSSHKEIPFDHLWSNKSNGSDIPSISFRFERVKSGSDLTDLPPVSCRLIVQQKGSISHQIIKINTDFPYAPVTDYFTGSSEISAAFSKPSHSNGSLTLIPSQRGFQFRLPSQTRSDLCQCLDHPNAKGNDWRMLAARLSVDRYLNYFACKSSPTEHILDLWEARNRDKTALRDLKEILRAMGRTDAVTILEKKRDCSNEAWI